MGTTYKSPIANDYLELRAELGTALFALISLAADAHLEPGVIQTLQSLQAGLREPFLFVVAGEVKAGKSSLLNALFGKEFCRVDVLPATDRIEIFKWGEQARDVPLSPSLVERYQPIGFLRDFNIVDTPGTNTIVAEHETITGQFAPLADLIVFVFSVVNPWGGSAWQFLEILQKKWLKNVIFVLQQADLREEREVEVVSRHLRQTAQTRFGMTFPTFAVSAKKAFLSKTSGVDKSRLWAESQFGPLEDYINEMVGTGDTRRAKLRSIEQTARVILGDVARQARNKERLIASDRTLLGRVREAVAQLSGRGELQVEGFLQGMDSAFSRCRQQGQHLLAQRLRFWRCVALIGGGGERWRSGFSRNIESILRASILKHAEHACGLLDEELQRVQGQLNDAVRPYLSIEARRQLARNVNDPPALQIQLMEKIDLALLETSGDDEVVQGFPAAFSRVGVGMRLTPAIAMAGVAAGLVSWRFAGVYAGIAGAALGLSMAGGTALLTAVRRRAALALYGHSMERRQEELRKAAGGLVRQAIGAFYERLSTAYVPVEAFGNAREEGNRPLMERVESLERILKKLDGRL